LKKILYVVLSLALAVSLTACGQNEATEDKLSHIGDAALDSGEAMETAGEAKDAFRRLRAGEMTELINVIGTAAAYVR
jgi:hypothetical protein